MILSQLPNVLPMVAHWREQEEDAMKASPGPGPALESTPQRPADPEEIPLSRAEREQALGLLERSRSEFLAALEGLREEQLRFKPTAERWSILQCAEHVAVTESLVGLGVVGRGLQAPAAPALRRDIEVVDATILRVMADPSRSFAAPDRVAPQGRLQDLKSVLAAYEDGHARLADALDDGAGLRTRVIPHPAFGPLDLYQWILMAAAHTSRHAEQILECRRLESSVGEIRP